MVLKRLGDISIIKQQLLPTLVLNMYKAAVAYV